MKAKKKKTIHIWKGQEGTVCGNSHLQIDEGFILLSMMNMPSAVQVNCKECLKKYQALATLDEQKPDELVRICPQCKKEMAQNEIYIVGLCPICAADCIAQLQAENTGLKAVLNWAMKILRYDMK